MMVSMLICKGVWGRLLLKLKVILAISLETLDLSKKGMYLGAIVVGMVASLFVIVGGCFVTWYCSCGSKSGNCIAGITGNSVLSFRSKDKASVPAATGLYSAR